MSDPEDVQRYSRLAVKVGELEKKVERIGQTLRDSLAAIARPGDTVILAFGRELDEDDIEHLTEAFGPLKERGIEVAFTDQVEGVTVASPADDENINDWSDEDRYGPEDV